MRLAQFIVLPLERFDASLSFQFHAEICPEEEQSNPDEIDKSVTRKYATYLKTRPATFELDAIDLVLEFSQKFKT